MKILHLKGQFKQNIIQSVFLMYPCVLPCLLAPNSLFCVKLASIPACFLVYLMSFFC